MVRLTLDAIQKDSPQRFLSIWTAGHYSRTVYERTWSQRHEISD